MKPLSAAKHSRRPVPDPANAVVQRLLTRSTVRLPAYPAHISVAARTPIRVAILAPERLFVDGLQVLLSREPGLRIVGKATEGHEVVEIMQSSRPDVVLLDPSLPDTDYLEIIRRAAQQTPSCRVLLLTAGRDAPEICRAVRAGARGYLSKSSAIDDVLKAIKRVHQGEVLVEPKLIANVLWGAPPGQAPSQRAPDAGGQLTVREREILRLLVSGATNRRIGETLFISEKTVKTHLNNMFRKLNVTRRLQAVLYAVRHGLREP